MKYFGSFRPTSLSVPVGNVVAEIKCNKRAPKGEDVRRLKGSKRGL